MDWAKPATEGENLTPTFPWRVKAVHHCPVLDAGPEGGFPIFCNICNMKPTPRQERWNGVRLEKRGACSTVEHAHATGCSTN